MTLTYYKYISVYYILQIALLKIWSKCHLRVLVRSDFIFFPPLTNFVYQYKSSKTTNIVSADIFDKYVHCCLTVLFDVC